MVIWKKRFTYINQRYKKENLVCRLTKSLYGLKQTPREWYKKLGIFMSNSRYTRSEEDHCCYFKHFDNSYIILLLYVDNMFITRPSNE